MALEFVRCKACRKPQRSDRIVCSSCGADVLTGEIISTEDAARDPPRAAPAEEAESSEGLEQKNIDKKQLLGLVGSIILFLGVFAPIVSLPIVGNANYFMNGRGDGTIVMVLAAISFVLVLVKEYRPLWITGLCSLVLTVFSFIIFRMEISRLRSLTNESLAGNPFRFLADIAIGSIQLQWGWAVLVVGSGLIIAAAATHCSLKAVPFGFQSRVSLISLGYL